MPIGPPCGPLKSAYEGSSLPHLSARGRCQENRPSEVSDGLPAAPHVKRGWDKWRARHQQKQQELFLEERKKEECRTAFKCESSRCYSRSARILTYIVSHTAWITKTKRAKSLRLREQEFANIHNKVDTFESM